MYNGYVSPQQLSSRQNPGGYQAAGQRTVDKLAEATIQAASSSTRQDVVRALSKKAVKPKKKTPYKYNPFSSNGLSWTKYVGSSANK